MEGKTIKEIHDIIHDDTFQYQVDKLVEIDRLILGEKFDEVECAKALNLSLPLGESKRKGQEQETKPIPKGKYPTPAFIGRFKICFENIKKVKYTFVKRDIGFIVNIIKAPMTEEDFGKICDYLEHKWEKRVDVKLEFDIKRIIENLTPASIYNNLNLLIAKSKETRSKSGWGYDFVKKKGEI
jgi:arsenate reductase-like glutaredoxin family protein